MKRITHHLTTTTTTTTPALVRVAEDLTAYLRRELERQPFFQAMNDNQQRLLRQAFAQAGRACIAQAQAVAAAPAYGLAGYDWLN